MSNGYGEEEEEGRPWDISVPFFFRGRENQRVRRKKKNHGLEHNEEPDTCKGHAKLK